MEKERTSPWLILFRVVFTAALIACIMFIFRNSLENGAQSSARSQAVMQLVNSALAKVHLGPLSEHLIRKLAPLPSALPCTSCARWPTSASIRWRAFC